MGIEDLKKKVADTGIMEKITDVGSWEELIQSKRWEDIIKNKLKEWLDEYKKTTAVLETFGFTVKTVTLKMGMPPEIHSSFLGSMEAIREERLRKMIEEHKAETLLVSLLKALIVTRWIWEHVEPKKKSVTLDVTLGVSPKVETKMD